MTQCSRRTHVSPHEPREQLLAKLVPAASEAANRPIEITRLRVKASMLAQRIGPDIPYEGRPCGPRSSKTRAVLRVLGCLGVLVFLSLAICLLAQWPSLKSHLSVEWDPFLLMLYAAAILAIGALTWWAKGRILMAIAATVTVAVVTIPMFSGATGWALPKLAIIALLALGFGQFTLKRIIPNAAITVGTRLLLATVLGYGVISLLMVLLGLLHCWQPASVVTVLAIAGLAVVRDVAEVFRQMRKEIRESWLPACRTGDLRLPALGLSVLCICGIGSYIFAVAPATHWDVLHYHLGIPRIYAERGELADLDHTWAVHCVRNGEMLYLLGLLVHGQPLPTLINFHFGLLATGLVASLAALVSNRQTGLLAGCIFFAIPLVSYLLAQGLIDLILTACIIAASYALFRWKHEGDAGWISLFSLFAGLAVGTKLNGLLLVGPLGVFLLLQSLYLGPDLRTRLTSCMKAILPGLLVLAPWLLLTGIRTGNPVFPFLNKVFRSTEWYQNSNTAGADWGGFGLGTTWYHGLRLPWDLTFHGERFCEFGWYGTAGILLLGMPFGYLLVSNRQRRAMLELTTVIVVSLLAFLKIAQYSRYMLPVFAFSSIIAALNCQAAWRLARRAPRARWLTLGLCAIIGFSWVFFTRAASLSELWYCLPERYPWRVALNRQSPDDYLRGALSEYELLKFIDEQIPQKPVAFVGLGIGSAFYSGDALEYSRWHSMAGREMICESSAERLVEMLKTKGIRYVAINHEHLKASRDGQALVEKAAVASPSFWNRYCEPVFGRKNIALYYVHYDGVHEAVPELRSLLLNGDLQLASDGSLPGWGVAPAARILSSGSNSLDPTATVLELTHDDMICQQIQVRPNTLYSLAADFWSPLKGQSCMLQFVWVDASGKAIANETLECQVDGSPRRYEVSRTTPPDAVAAAIYLRAQHGGDIVRMSRPKLIERNPSMVLHAGSRVRLARHSD